MYTMTIYTLGATLLLLTGSFCRLVPRIPQSGGLLGPRFWLALVLVFSLYRTLNTLFFTLQTTLYDQPDAATGLGAAVVLTGLTVMLINGKPSATDHR